MRIRITNEKQFVRKLREFAERTALAPGLIAKEVAFQAFAGVVERTPVDTGWARASWNIAEGNPDVSVPPKPGDDTVLPPPIPAAVDSSDPFPVYFVTNALDYIGELEKGRSKQIGKGYMSQRTLAAIEADIGVILRSLRL